VRTVDDGGAQEFAIQASGDQGVIVGGNLTTKVDVDEKYNVKGNLNTTVDGTQMVKVGAVQEIVVGSGCITKVAGNRTVLVGGMEEIGVDLNRALDCAADYCEAVGGLYFVRCNNSNDTLKAGFMQTVGTMVIAAAAGVNEQVVGARVEACAGARVIGATKMECKAYGVMSINCGQSTFTAGADIISKAKSLVTMGAGLVSLTGSGGVVIGGGDSVIISAGKLSCGGYTAAGSHSLSGWLVLADNSTAEFSSTKADS